MAWFYNSRSGDYTESSAPSPEFFVLEGLLHAGEGWHEYSSQQQMLAAIQQNHWPAPTGNLSQNLKNSLGNTVSTIAKAIPGAGNIDDLISFVKQGSIWTRAGEFIVGAILLYIGLKAIVTPGQSSTPVRGTVKQSVKKVAKKVVK